LIAELLNAQDNSCVTVHDVFETAYAACYKGRDSADGQEYEAALKASRALVPGMHLLAAWLGISLESRDGTPQPSLH